MTPDYLNVTQILGIIALTGISINATFEAYKAGVERRLIDLRKNCRFLGVSILVLTGGSIFVGIDITARCICRFDEMEHSMQNTIEQLSAKRANSISAELVQNPMWTVTTPNGNEIKWSLNDGVRAGEIERTERFHSGRYGSLSSRPGDSGIIRQYEFPDQCNGRPNSL